ALAKQGNLELAEDAFRQTLRLQPNHVKAHSNLGNALMSQGKLDEAVAYLQQATRLQPGYADAHRNLGIAWLLAGNFEQGWPEYEWRWPCPDLPPRPLQQP